MADNVANSERSVSHRGLSQFGPDPVTTETRLLEAGRKWSLEIPSPHPQLTLKGIITGCCVGVLCSFLALYYGLKTGIVPSMNILSGLAGFVFLKSLLSLGVFSGVFTPQENAVVQTAAVATYAVSCPGFGFTSGYLAMLPNSYIALGPDFDGNNAEDVIKDSWWREVMWCLGLAYFGFFIAFPLRTNSVIKQRLTFPSGTATAFVIKSMHSSAAKAKHSFAIMAKFFSISFVINCFTWVFQGLAHFPIFGMEALKYSWYMDWDLGSFGIGFILSNKVNASLFFGAFLAFGMLEPVLDNHVEGPLFFRYAEGAGSNCTDPIPDSTYWYDLECLPSLYLDATAYTLFGGLAIMIVQGALSIGMLLWMLVSESDWGKRTFGGGVEDETVQSIDENEKERRELMDQIFSEAKFPLWWTIVGYSGFGVFCILVMTFLFETPWYQVLVALFIIPIFAISNIQGMGRTDWDVASSYGKLIMFPFGQWNAGGSIIPSLVLCIVTISGCSNAAVLMQDFKTGHLLGATPTAMLVAQLIGQTWGCIVTPSLFTMLNAAFVIPSGDDSSFLPGIYGPIYRTLAIVATGGGFSSLPDNTLAIAGGFVLMAVILDVLEIFGPPKVVDYLPDPTAMAIGFLVGAGPPMKFFIGGMIRTFWAYFEPEIAKERSPYIASGCIAGSGMAIVLQCILSLAGMNGFILVDYMVNPLNDMTAGLWVAAFIFLLVPVAVGVCGAYYWFPGVLVEEEDVTLIEKAKKLGVSDSSIYIKQVELSAAVSGSSSSSNSSSS